MYATSPTQIIDPDSYDLLSECSLYRAICFIAYKEKPILEDYASLFYPDRFFKTEADEIAYVEDEENDRWLAFQEEYSIVNDEYMDSFLAASKALLIKLIEGKIEATGKKFSDTRGAWYNPEYKKEYPDFYYHGYISHKTEPEFLLPEYWKNYGWSKPKIDWCLNELTYEDIFVGETIKFGEITINTNQLYEVFSDKSVTKKSKVGRKEHPDWKPKFYPEIVWYFYNGADIMTCPA